MSEPIETEVVELTGEQREFADAWRDATPEDKRPMANVAKVGQLFQGESKAVIKEVFGEATKSGVDNFGEDMMRYELGGSSEFGGDYLHFVFEEGVVTSVMGSYISTE